MKNKSFALKAAAAAVVLLGAAMSAQAGSGSASVGVQLNALAVGTCSVTPDAASFVLPESIVGTAANTYVAANFPTAAIFTAYAFKTHASLNQTFKLMCGSATSITSMTIAPAAAFVGSSPAYGFLRDSAGKSAFQSTGNTTGITIGSELVSVNGTSTPFTFQALPSTAVPSYSTAFTVGTTPVPVVWRPTMLNGPWGTTNAALVAPTDPTGYKTDFVITVNY